MARLPTYTANLGGPITFGGRRATAADFGGTDLSSGAKTVQKAAMSYLSSVEDEESRTVLVQQAQIRAKYAKRLDEAATNGEDLEKIREDLDNDLAGVSENLQTKKGLETATLHAANTGAIFDTAANQIAVRRAASAARLAGANFLTSTGELVSTNPAYLPQAEKDVDDFVTTLSKIPPGQRAEIAQSLKENLNVAAAMANLRADPDGTKSALESGKYTITPKQREQLIGEANTAVRARRAEESYERAQKEFDIRQRDDKARDEHFKSIIEGSATRGGIMADDNLRPETREHLILLMEARAKGMARGTEGKSDPQVYRDLWLRVNAQDGDPTKIFNSTAIVEAVAAGTLNTTDANRLNTLIANQRDENNRTFGSRLNLRLQSVIQSMRASPQFAAQPELAAAMQIEIVNRAEQRAAELRKDNKDPASLLDPNSKDYLFTPDLLKTVQHDVQSARNSQIPKPPQVSSDADLLAIPVGGVFIDPNGVMRYKTQAMQDAITKANTPSDEDLFKQWMLDTGGVLKPGQNQLEAFNEWKASRGGKDLGYGKRADGTQKGPGFFGELQDPDGRVSTEISVGVKIDGKETQIPLLVPGLTRKEIDYLLAGGSPTPAIVNKAAEHALARIHAGKSPFAQQGEQVTPPKG